MLPWLSWLAGTLLAASRRTPTVLQGRIVVDNLAIADAWETWGPLEPQQPSRARYGATEISEPEPLPLALRFAGPVARSLFRQIPELADLLEVPSILEAKDLADVVRYQAEAWAGRIRGEYHAEIRVTDTPSVAENSWFYPDQGLIRVGLNPFSLGALVHEGFHALDNYLGRHPEMTLRLYDQAHSSIRAWSHRPTIWASSRFTIPDDDGMIRSTGHKAWPQPLGQVARVLTPFATQQALHYARTALYGRWEGAGLPTDLIDRLHAGEKIPLQIALDAIELRESAATVLSWRKPAEIFASSVLLEIPARLPPDIADALRVLATFLMAGTTSPPSDPSLLRWRTAGGGYEDYYSSPHEILARLFDQVASQNWTGGEGGATWKKGWYPPSIVQAAEPLLAAALVQHQIPIQPAWAQKAEQALGEPLGKVDLGSAAISY